ncbi:MAG TPA: hypothetical protein VLG38_00085 [Gammaproteobacteria bacterium]|nr:hypothetical protein [Gammaproteobacteria bacterium]
MSNKDMQNFEAMAQMLEMQARKLQELEMRLQREKQEKANLEMDFHHLLDQLNGISGILSLSDDHAVVCG